MVVKLCKFDILEHAIEVLLEKKFYQIKNYDLFM